MCGPATVQVAYAFDMVGDAHVNTLVILGEIVPIAERRLHYLADAFARGSEDGVGFESIVSLVVQFVSLLG
jgi:hypothetical protein